MKLRIFLIIAFASLVAGTPSATAVTLNIPSNYCQLPPFLNNTVSRKPNILVLQDNSGSMAYAAYRQAFQSNKSYYGYFDTAKCYAYATGLWKESVTANADYSCPNPSAGQWSGTFLNWVSMRRIDIARKVLVGGKGNPRTGSQVKLLGESDVYFGFNKTASANNYTPFIGNVSYAISNTSNKFTIGMRSLGITSGGSHTCSGTPAALYCWGGNGSGQLGNNSSQDETTPSSVFESGLSRPVTAAAGEDHTCAISSTGTIQCWGENNDGQLGNGGTTDSKTPRDTEVALMKLPVQSISSGLGFSCAIDAAGDLWCWGKNDVGQLGLNHTSARTTPAKISLSNVLAVSAGAKHVCATTSAGFGFSDLHCWGSNDQGQLGCGATSATCGNPQLKPTPITGGKLISSIAAGFAHTCASIGFSAFCWGANGSGQLGNNSTISSNVPAVVYAGSMNDKIIRVAAGGYEAVATTFGHTCAIESDGDLWCWGENSNGQIGNNSTTDRRTPIEIINGTGGNADANEISLGGAHSCVLIENGTVYCWGKDNKGQVGNDNQKTDKRTPQTLFAGSIYAAVTYNIEVQTSKGASEITGVLHDLKDQAKIGLMFFNSSEGGNVVRPIGTDGANLISLETSLENVAPNTSTPLAEALYTGVRYFRWDAPPFSAYTRANGANGDPWTDPCANSFILLLTDGEPTNDDNIVLKPLADYDGNGRDYSRAESDQFGLANTAGTFDDYLDDIALWANYPRNEINGVDNPLHDGSNTRTKGHRYDKGIPTYLVYTFGDPKFINFHKRVGINGAFVDRNGNNKPDLQSEWDQDADGQADGFFNAEEGDQIEGAIRKAFSAMLQRTAAGTSISMVSTNRRGDGSIVQSYFRPIFTSDAKELNWLGMLQSLWIDSSGNVREDTNQNQKLDLKEDRIVVYRFDAVNKETVANIFKDADGNGKRDRLLPNTALGDSENVPLYLIKPLWEGGAELAKRSALSRHIITNYDADGDQIVDPGEAGPFDRSQSFGGVALSSLLSNADHDGDGYGIPSTWAAALENVIEFVRGAPVSQASGGWDEMFRNRQVVDFEYQGSQFTGEWKLGDIMFSTPIIVAEPAERYDLLPYHDKSYAAFYAKYSKRKPVMYSGANDGAFHVYNPGQFNSLTNAFSIATIGGGSDTFGAEIAAIVPGKTLPMLQYVASKQYGSTCHISFMDQPPRVTDARVFADDARHPNGWGTLLIAQMRMGCHDKKYSSMIILDITDPDFAFDPMTAADKVLLAELAPADLGFTFSFPAVVKTGKIDQGDLALSTDKWFLVVGAGPDDMMNVKRSTDAALYIWDLKKMIHDKTIVMTKLSGASGLIAPKSFTSGILSVDADLNYEVEALYFGTVEDKFATSKPRWGGSVWRVLIGRGATEAGDPTKWQISKVLDGDAAGEGRPFAETPNVYLDPDAIKSGQRVPYVTFVSGRFLSRTDPYDDLDYPCIGVASPCNSTRSYQAIYTLKDACLTSGGACALYTSADLVDVTRLGVQLDGTLINQSTTGLPGAIDSFGKLETHMKKDTTRGWTMRLGDTVTSPDNHERASGNPVFHAATRGLFFSTYAPGQSSTESCTATGSGKVYAVHFRTGTSDPFNPILFGSNAQNPNLPTIADNDTATADPYRVGLTKDPNCATCGEKVVTGIPGLPSTPTIHKNKLIIQDNNADLITMDRGSGPTSEKGFILWRIL